MKPVNALLKFTFAVFFIASLFLIPVQGLASDLTLSEAIDTALAKNPGLQAAGFRVDAASEKTIQARSGALPQVHLNGGYSRTTNPMWAFGTKLNQEAITSQDFDPGRLNDPDDIGNYGSSLSVVWPVYDQGRTWYGVQQARLNQDSVQLYAQRARQEVIAGTITAYIGALLARENEIVIRQATDTARSHLKLIQSRYDGGFVAKSDLLRAQVHIADLEQQLAEAKSSADIAKCRLTVVMGVAGEFDLTLTSPLDPGEPIQGDLDSWINKALTVRPDLKSLSLQKDIAKKEVDKSKAARLPSVNLTGNYEINSEELDDHGNSYTVGAALSLPLYTGGRISAAIREAESNLKQTDAMLRSLNQQVCGETRQAFFNAKSSWERIPVAKAAVGQAEESLRIVKNRYDSGLFTITDLLDAEAAVQQSRMNHLKSLHDYKSAATRLSLASGSMDKI
ncbi:MAG: TolC family protein [Desulfobacula sp.]|jgi:TolC family type I secretion outer membrane protein